MSLINQMLKDLDARQAESTNHGLDVLGSQVGVSVGRRQASNFRWLWIAGVLLALGFAAYVWSERGRRGTPSADAPTAVNIKPLASASSGKVPPSTGEGTSQAPTSPREATQAVTTSAAVETAVATQAKRPVQTPKLAVGNIEMAQAQVASDNADPSQAAPAVSIPAVATPERDALESVSKTESEQSQSAAQGTSVVLGPSVRRSVDAKQRTENSYRSALSAWRAGQKDIAEQALKDLLRAQPRHVDARQLLAWLYSQTQRPQQAVELLKQGLKLDARALAFYRALALLQLDLGEADAAIATLEQGLAVADSDASYHAQLASALQAASRHAEARTHYVLALRQSPRQANWLLALGASLQALQENRAASEAYRQALDLGLDAQMDAFARERLQVMGY